MLFTPFAECARTVKRVIALDPVGYQVAPALFQTRGLSAHYFETEFAALLTKHHIASFSTLTSLRVPLESAREVREFVRNTTAMLDDLLTFNPFLDCSFDVVSRTKLSIAGSYNATAPFSSVVYITGSPAFDDKFKVMKVIESYEDSIRERATNIVYWEREDALADVGDASTVMIVTDAEIVGYTKEGGSIQIYQPPQELAKTARDDAEKMTALNRTVNFPSATAALVNFTSAHLSKQLRFSSSALDLIAQLNGELALRCPDMHLRFGRNFTMPGFAACMTMTRPLELHVLCLYNGDACVSSIELKGYLQRHKVEISSRTNKLFQKMHLNSLLRAVAVQLLAQLRPQVRELTSFAVNPISVYVLVNKLGGTLPSKSSTQSVRRASNLSEATEGIDNLMSDVTVELTDEVVERSRRVALESMNAIAEKHECARGSVLDTNLAEALHTVDLDPLVLTPQRLHSHQLVATETASV
jgi:hypothetical protein